MKGTFFAKPLEWNIEVKGEAWEQGAPVTGQLTLKNHGADLLPLSNMSFNLAQGDIKKVHSRDPKAFKVFETLPGLPAQLAAHETLTLPINFTLPANCGVTDRRSSFYLAYGVGGSEANLQLKVEPRRIFGEVTKLMENFQRFKTKEIKAAKSGVEFKLLPPSSRDWAHVESLSMTLAMEGELLKMAFLFNVKAIDTKSVTTALTKETREFAKELAPREYSLGRDMPNQDGLNKALESVLLQVKNKGF